MQEPQPDYSAFDVNATSWRTRLHCTIVLVCTAYLLYLSNPHSICKDIQIFSAAGYANSHFSANPSKAGFFRKTHASTLLTIAVIRRDTSSQSRLDPSDVTDSVISLPPPPSHTVQYSSEEQ